jgi:hypothetical protein
VSGSGLPTVARGNGKEDPEGIKAIWFLRCSRLISAAMHHFTHDLIASFHRWMEPFSGLALRMLEVKRRERIPAPRQINRSAGTD